MPESNSFRYWSCACSWQFGRVVLRESLDVRLACPLGQAAFVGRPSEAEQSLPQPSPRDWSLGGYCGL
jgi:hypothetical protein